IKSVNKILNLCDLQANSKIIALDSEKNPLKESIVNLIKVGSDVEPLTNTHSKGVVESGYEDSKINQLLSSDNNKNFIDVTKLVSSKLHALLSEHISTKSIISKVALLTKLGAEVSIENYEILSNIIENGKEITKSQDELTNK